MKNLLPIIIFSFFFPLISSAQLIPTGPQCYPDDVKVDRFCPYGPNSEGSTFVKLEWDLNKSYNRPYCTLRCNKASSSCSSIFRKDENGIATNQYPYNTVETWLKNFNLKPTDDIIIKKGTFGLAEGNTYTVRCCEVSDQATMLSICKDNPSTISPKMTIVGPAGRCERPFSAIIDDLNNMRHTIITEESFRDWTDADPRDNVINKDPNVIFNAHFGSGDSYDIKAAMSQIQTSCGSFSPSDLSLTNVGLNAVLATKRVTDTNQPLTMELFMLNNNIGHQVIALDVSDEGYGRYNITVLDPSYLGIFSVIKCGTRNITMPSTGMSAVGLVCDYDDGYGHTDTVVPIRVSNSFVESLRVSFGEYCRNHSVSDFCQERQNMSRWLKGHYPNFGNFITIQSPEGNCAGWSHFMLSVAYLGEFTNKDWHPDDGCGVGYACDANRNSIDEPQITSALPTTSWLANLSQLTKLINLPGLIGWPVRQSINH